MTLKNVVNVEAVVLVVTAVRMSRSVPTRLGRGQTPKFNRWGERRL